MIHTVISVLGKQCDPSPSTEDENDAKPVLFQTTTPLNNLLSEDEGATIKQELNNVAFLNESPETPDVNASITNDDNITKSIITKNVQVEETQLPWKIVAAAIFELSHVYPFIHASNMKYKCFVCGDPFTDATELKQHMPKHNHTEIKKKVYKTAHNAFLKVDITNMRCRQCNETFESLHNLKTHLKTHKESIDLDVKDNLVPYKLDDVPFRCQVCGEVFLKIWLLVIHMNKHYNNFSCEICGASFISQKSLRCHLRTHETGNFPCDQCDKVFSNSAKKVAHMQGVHASHYRRRCPVCPVRFNSSYMKTKHMRVVHNKTDCLNKCNTCGLTFDLKYHLQLHIRSVHFQEKNEECPHCQARFFSKSLLSRHMTTHTGAKNHKCGVCGKAFGRKSHLDQHSRTHASELSRSD